MLAFTKMNGAGNDFVLMDNRAGKVTLSPSDIAQICDRHRGVGADGLLLVEPSASDTDFLMRYYNSDGSEAEMCGNGARCFARYAAQLAGFTSQISFDTLAGVIRAELLDDNIVRLNMSEPFDLSMHNTLDVLGKPLAVHSVNTGVPHAIVMVDAIESVDVVKMGNAIRFHPHFAPKGTNVNFFQRIASNLGALRTYERGVENETLACGTGMVAAAIVYSELSATPGPIAIRVRGGETLQVGFNKQGDRYQEVTLTGPADFVFTGKLEI